MVIEKLYSQFKIHPKISTDSRNIEEGAIFFALKGDSFNGNKFADQALANGASYVVLDEDGHTKSDKALLVDDVLTCLQELAKHHRNNLNIPVLAITGTNGKTTTKELLATVLAKKFKVSATKGNFNNHIGVPLTLLSIPFDADFSIVEMGANHIGEIAQLCEIAQPDYGLITNIGKAHLEGFGSFEGVKKAKGELYEYIRNKGNAIFKNIDNQILNSISGDVVAYHYGANVDTDVFGQVTETDPFLSLEFFDSSDKLLQPYAVATRLAGEYNFENVMAAVRIGLYFGVEKNELIAAIESYEPQNKRSQILSTKTNKLVVDAYNANPTSMSLAIRNFGKMKAQNKSLVLGDMLELGEYSLSEHKGMIELIMQSNWECVFLVGGEFQKANIETEFLSFSNVNELISHLEKNPIHNNLILIKGSRGIQLETIIDQL